MFSSPAAGTPPSVTGFSNASVVTVLSANCTEAVVTAPHGAVYCIPMVLPTATCGSVTTPFTGFCSTAAPSTVMTAPSFTQPDTVISAMGRAPLNTVGSTEDSSARSVASPSTACPAAVVPVTVQVYRPGNRF